MLQVLFMASLLSTAFGQWSSVPVFDYHHSNTRFSADLYEALAILNSNDNFIISPMVTHSMLALFATGARGFTLSKLASALYLPNSPSLIESMFSEVTHKFPIEGSTTIAPFINLFVNDKRGVNESFQANALNYFKSGIDYFNFRDEKSLAAHINKWIDSVTSNTTTHIFPYDVNPESNLIVVSTIWIKGDWLHHFNSDKPYHTKFYIDEKHSVPVDLFTVIANLKFYYDEEFSAHYIEFPLKDTETYLTLIVPHLNDGLKTLENDIYHVIKKTPTPNDYKEVYLMMPKFKLSKSINIKDVSEVLGLASLFQEGADFRNIVDDPKYHLENVRQNIEIHSSKTGINVEVSNMLRGSRRLSPTTIFKVDHPFVYTIKNKNGGILLIGRYTRPE